MTHQHLQKMFSITRRRLISGESPVLRRFSTSETTPRKVDKRKLYTKLCVVGSNGGRMSDVLNQLSGQQGKELTMVDLVSCVKHLRKFGRHQNCLEILEWMDKNIDKSSDNNQALRLGIIYNVEGIGGAENYFTSLPSNAKTIPTYGSLLNCYCAEKCTDKALALFKEMDGLNFSNIVAFNNLMGLYMKVGQPEKVPPLVEEMKRKHIELNSYSYSVLIQSYGSLNDLEGVENIANEVELHSRTNRDWTIYSTLASVYIKVGQSEKAKLALRKLEGFLDNSYSPERDAYHYLISLCSSLGDLDYVNQVWGKLKSRFKICNNSSYLNMLYSLSKLNDIEGMKNLLKEWETGCEFYDVRLPNAVIDACLKRNMIKEAEQLLKDATNKVGEKMCNSHLSFMKHYLRKKQTDLALRHVEVVIDNNWNKFVGKIVNVFFDYFMKGKDVDGAEKFCVLLKKGGILDSRVYLWLLQIYVAAGKRMPDMRWRMEKDGVEIGSEHENLLRKICANYEVEICANLSLEES